jgi:trypsin
MCVGQVAAGPGVCITNRGSGVYCNGRLSGILNFGFGCGAANQPGVYTQVRFFRQWIEQQFNREDVPPAGTTQMPIQT